MDVRIIAVGRRMPRWVEAAWQDYQGRFPRQVAVELVDIAPETRSGIPTPQILASEAGRISAACRDGAIRVVMDERGRSFTSVKLARWLEERIGMREPVDLIIGGADGTDPALRAGADLSWSLSDLTLPHALVRVVLIEQLYRAWTMLEGHPYHRV